MSIFSSYSIKKVWGFQNIFSRIFKILQKKNFETQTFEIWTIHKPSQGSSEVPHKIWARSFQPFWRLLDTNRQTDKLNLYIAFGWNLREFYVIWSVPFVISISLMSTKKRKVMVFENIFRCSIYVTPPLPSPFFLDIF